MLSDRDDWRARASKAQERVAALETAVTSMSERFLALGHPVESLGAMLTAVDAKLRPYTPPEPTEAQP